MFRSKLLIKLTSQLIWSRPSITSHAFTLLSQDGRHVLTERKAIDQCQRTKERLVALTKERLVASASLATNATQFCRRAVRVHAEDKRLPRVAPHDWLLGLRAPRPLGLRAKRQEADSNKTGEDADSEGG
eukprot:6175127-Pleurochrysis_carterae.AAC.1